METERDVRQSRLPGKVRVVFVDVAAKVSTTTMAPPPVTKISSCRGISVWVTSSTKGRSNCPYRQKNSVSFLLSVLSTMW